MEEMREIDALSEETGEQLRAKVIFYGGGSDIITKENG